MSVTGTALGVFDSGIGGFSVLRAIRDRLPHMPIMYFADQGHVPYGSRPEGEVRDFSERIAAFLIQRGAKVIVVACNTASAAALHHLRVIFPSLPFVGMEPAVKPAAELTRTGVVGVLATPATFQGALYASVIERFASGVTVLQATCPGLVQRIEAGELGSRSTRRILEKALLPMLEQKIDTIVLGCTHFPFVIPLIKDIAGAEVRVIDPAPAIARQTARVLGESLPPGQSPSGGSMIFYTSGRPEQLRAQIASFLGDPGAVQAVEWIDGQIVQKT